MATRSYYYTFWIMVFDCDNFTSSSLCVGNNSFLINRLDCKWIHNAYRDSFLAQFIGSFHCMNKSDSGTNHKNLVFFTLLYNLNNIICLLWYVMVCYGMLWYGMVWYGMVWYGMVWYGMVWYGMVWYGMVW